MDVKASAIRVSREVLGGTQLPGKPVVRPVVFLLFLLFPLSPVAVGVRRAPRGQRESSVSGLKFKDLESP